jgi:hypothetical protein
VNRDGESRNLVHLAQYREMYSLCEEGDAPSGATKCREFSD